MDPLLPTQSQSIVLDVATKRKTAGLKTLRDQLLKSINKIAPTKNVIGRNILGSFNWRFGLLNRQ